MSADALDHTPEVVAPAYATLVARALLARPELLAIARANVAAWVAIDAHASDELLWWDAQFAKAQASEAGMDALQAALTDPDPVSARRREFAPLAGLLTRAERRTARELCGFRH